MTKKGGVTGGGEREKIDACNEKGIEVILWLKTPNSVS